MPVLTMSTTTWSSRGPTAGPGTRSGSPGRSPNRSPATASRRCPCTDSVTRGRRLALKAGVHPKVVQERLGHSTIGITLDVYSHVLPAMETDAADRVAALIYGVQPGA